MNVIRMNNTRPPEQGLADINHRRDFPLPPE
jgi:hypothetical protein